MKTVKSMVRGKAVGQTCQTCGHEKDTRHKMMYQWPCKECDQFRGLFRWCPKGCLGLFNEVPA